MQLCTNIDMPLRLLECHLLPQQPFAGLILLQTTGSQILLQITGSQPWSAGTTHLDTVF